MDDKFINKINKLKEKIDESVVEYLKNKSFTVDEFISACKENKIRLTPKILGAIARLYDSELSEKKAFKIYQYAANLEDPEAMGNLAIYYYRGLAPCVKNLTLAKKWCKKAIDVGVIHRNILMAKIHIEEKDYLLAMECLQEVTSPKCEKDELEEARELEKSIMMKNLKKLYASIDHSEAGSESSEIDEMGAMHLGGVETLGWIEMDVKTDGFDIDLCGTMSEKLEVLRSQVAAEEDPALKRNFRRALQEIEEAFDLYIDIEAKLIQRQVQTENRFFNPHRTSNKQTFKLAGKLERRRLKEASLPPVKFSVSGSEAVSARGLITAERSTVETSIAMRPHSPNSWYEYKIGWKYNPNPVPSIPHKRYDAHYTFCETIDFFGSKIQYAQRVNSHCNHLGDYYMYDLGEYAHIMSILDGITGTTKDRVEVQHEQALASLMLGFSHDGKPVILLDLATIKPQASQIDVDNLNRIFYHCFAKEIARWMLPTHKSHNLPLATAQARALQLIIKGHLSLRQVFGPLSDCGVFTGKNVGSDLNALRTKIVRINNLYETHILTTLPAYQTFKAEHPNGKVVSSRKGLRSELQTTFGGEGDTDGEGYESDNERENLYKRVMATM